MEKTPVRSSVWMPSSSAGSFQCEIEVVRLIVRDVFPRVVIGLSIFSGNGVSTAKCRTARELDPIPGAFSIAGRGP